MEYPTPIPQHRYEHRARHPVSMCVSTAIKGLCAQRCSGGPTMPVMEFGLLYARKGTSPLLLLSSPSGFPNNFKVFQFSTDSLLMGLYSSSPISCCQTKHMCPFKGTGVSQSSSSSLPWRQTVLLRACTIFILTNDIWKVLLFVCWEFGRERQEAISVSTTFKEGREEDTSLELVAWLMKVPG